MYVPPFDAATRCVVPNTVSATSWEAVNLLDISDVTIWEPSRNDRNRRKSDGGVSEAGDAAGSLNVDKSVNSVTYGPTAGQSVFITLGVGSSAKTIRAAFPTPNAASNFCTAIRNNILAIQANTPVLWEGWVKRSAGLGFKSQFLQLRPSGLYFFGRPSPQGSNKDSIRWFAKSNSVDHVVGRTCVVKCPKRAGMPNLGALAVGGGRSLAVDLETMLNLAAGDEGLAAFSSSTKSGPTYTVCKFSVVEADNFNSFKTAFDSMTKFQMVETARRQQLFLQSLAVDHNIEKEIRDTASQLGVHLKADWEAAVLRPVLHQLADELVNFWF